MPEVRLVGGDERCGVHGLAGRLRARGLYPIITPLKVHALGKILIYLVAVLLLGAALSPVAYDVVQGLAARGVLVSLAEFPFHRYFTRTVQVSAVVLLAPLLFWLGIRRLSEFGLQRNPRALRDLAAGVLLAAGPALLLGAVYFWGDIYRVKKTLDFFALPRIAVTACFVAMVEEFLFRGVALGLAARSLGRIPALLGVSALFAAVHFIKPGRAAEDQVAWWSGFAQIPRAFESVLPWGHLITGFLALFAIGLILGWAALRTRSLWLPIGLHAGWILAQQGLQWVGRYRLKPPDALFPWIGPNVVSGAVPTGLVPLFFLLLTGILVWLFLRHEPASRPRSGD